MVWKALPDVHRGFLVDHDDWLRGLGVPVVSLLLSLVQTPEVVGSVHVPVSPVGQGRTETVTVTVVPPESATPVGVNG